MLDSWALEIKLDNVKHRLDSINGRLDDLMSALSTALPEFKKAYEQLQQRTAERMRLPSPQRTPSAANFKIHTGMTEKTNAYTSGYKEGQGGPPSTSSNLRGYTPGGADDPSQ